MKLTTKAAVGFALVGAASAAFATSVTPPATGPTPAPSAGAGGVVVEVWDTNNPNVGLSEYLGFDTTTFGGPAEAAAGRLLDFGVLGTSSFLSTFSAADIAGGFVKFAITGANAPSGSSPIIDVTLNTVPAITNGGLNTIVTSLSTAVGSVLNSAAACNNVNPCIATTGTADPNYTVGNLGSAIGGLAGNTAGTAGSGSVAFYQLTKNGTSALTAAIKTPFANATGAGVWALSATGDLTYTVPGGTAVPLPAAFWLLGSGLLGLAGVSRRKTLAA